jgi:hypothetical protein
VFSLRVPLLALGALTASCAAPLEASECKQLLEHYTGLLVISEQRHASSGDIESAKFRARLVAESQPHFQFTSCSTEVRRAQFECAMNAPDVDALERCLTL